MPLMQTVCVWCAGHAQPVSCLRHPTIPRSCSPQMSEPPPKSQTTFRGPNGQRDCAIAAIGPSARAHCCSGGQVTQARRPIGPAPAAALQIVRADSFAPYITCQKATNVRYCVWWHTHGWGWVTRTRGGYDLVWGMMGDGRVLMRTFCWRARRRNVELRGQFPSLRSREWMELEAERLGIERADS